MTESEQQNAGDESGFSGAELAAELEQPSVRALEIGGRSFETNFPPHALPFEERDDNYPGEAGRLDRLNILPSTLDDLSPGEYFIAGDGQFRKLVILDTDYGKVIQTADKFGTPKSDRSPGLRFDGVGVTPGLERLTTELGFLIDQDERSGDRSFVTGVPTPETIKSAAATLGVEIELFSGKDLLPGQPYLQTFADGKYPVATGSEFYYCHDIQDDHLTAMILGGPELRDVLARVASHALEDGDDDIIAGTAGLIDGFTNALRNVSALTSGNTGYTGEYGEEQYRYQAELLGIPADQAEELLAVTRTRAEQFGLQPYQ